MAENAVGSSHSADCRETYEKVLNSTPARGLYSVTAPKLSLFWRLPQQARSSSAFRPQLN